MVCDDERTPPVAEGKKLVIVESPTKMRSIQGYLGDGYEVLSSVGHIRDLADKKDIPADKKQAYGKYSIDVDKGWVIFKNINTMRDPGDGSVHGAGVITVLHYAGDDKWSFEEDAYNPMNFLTMIQGYIQRSHELGTISDDARTFAANMGWQLT